MWRSCRAIRLAGLVWIGLILFNSVPSIADPSLPVDTSAAESAPQTDVQRPEYEAVTPDGDTASQADEEHLVPESVAPAGDSDAMATEQLPDTEVLDSPSEVDSPTNTPAPDATTEPPVNGKTSLFKSIFKNTETAFTLNAGFRKDNLQWSIAGNSAGSNPNVLSELTWSDVDSHQLTLTNRTIFNRRFYFRGEMNYAFIKSGRVQDSDYDEDNRRNENSRSISDSSGDQIWDISISGGYPFFFLEDRLLVTPLFGLSHHVQNLRITDGEQVLTSTGQHPLGPLSDGLNSTYRSGWSGPWIGCDLRYALFDGSDNLPMEFGFSLELHYADYKAEANWNLNEAFQHPKSFEHEAKGYGIAMTGEWLFGLGEQWDFVFRTTYQYWQAEDGVDRLYKADGTESKRRLNEVAWHNHSATVGVNFHF